MLIKTLLTVALLCVALASNGAGPAEASNRQDLRPVPAVPATTETSACTEQPDSLNNLNNQARNCVKIFIKRIHSRQQAASFSRI
jgi:hypothetical protein